MDLTTAYALLGVTAETPLAEVRDRFRMRARMMHPDRVAADGGEIALEAGRAMAGLNEAWAAIQRADALGTRHPERAHASASSRNTDEPTWRAPIEGECDICGTSPARRLRLRATTGMLLVRQDAESQLDLCLPCGVNMFRTVQASTLVTGWWALLAAVMNVRFLVGNYVAVRRHRRMVPPPQHRDPLVVTPMDPPVAPVRPVFLRVGPVVATAFVSGLFALFVVGMVVGASAGSEDYDPDPVTKVGTCLDRFGHEVGCLDSEAAYELTARVSSVSRCGYLDVFEADNGDIYCGKQLN